MKQMTVGPRSLRYVCPNLTPKQARAIAPLLGAAMERHGIDTKKRAAMFIAQIAHETGGFRWLGELWGPTAAQRGYEGRRDLGNTQPGDGFRFRGRGYLHHTGRHEYARLSRAFDVDFVSRPERVATHKWGTLAAANYWQSRNINRLADRDDFEGVTRAINGGLNGYRDRCLYYRRARKVAGFLVPKRRRVR